MVMEPFSKMVPDESCIINGEIKTALVKLKETKEKRWSIIKQKFFEKYEQCAEEEEENGYETYLAIEESLPSEKVTTVKTNKADRGAWVEQEFIAPELKPYHEEAERLRHDIEDKIKTLNLMVNPNSTEILPIESDKQDSTISEASLIDKKAHSSSVMRSTKKQVKKKVKRTPERLEKCNKDSASSSLNLNEKGQKRENLETVLIDDESSVKVNKRNVQDEELEEALKKLHENKMRRWTMIKQKFYEKYEKIGENSAESGGNGHRKYESLGQEANLVYVSEDLADHHKEANNLRDFIEDKILTLKPYQAKLKKKKKAQQAKECSEITMEKIVQATLQFQKKCALNGDNIVQSINLKSPSSSAGKDNPVVMEKVSPSKSPKANHSITPSSSSGPSPKKIAMNPKSPIHKKTQKASRAPTLHKSVRNASKSSCDKNSEQPSVLSSDGESNQTSHLVSDSSVSAQDQKSPKRKSGSKLPQKNQTVQKFQKRQSIKTSKNIIDSEETTELDSESVIDESSPIEDLHSFTTASNSVLNASTDQLLFKHAALKNQTVQSKETCKSNLDLFDRSCFSKSEKESESDRKTSPTKHQPLKSSSKIKELHPKKDCLPSTSSFWDNQDMEQFSSQNVEMTASDSLSNLNSTSIKNNLKESSPVIKKRRHKSNKDQSTSESVETTTFDCVLDSTPVRSNLKESSSSAKKRKWKNLKNNNILSKRTNRLSNPSHNLSLPNIKPVCSIDVLSSSSREENDLDLEKSLPCPSRSVTLPSFRNRSPYHLSKSPTLRNVPIDILVRPSN